MRINTVVVATLALPAPAYAGAFDFKDAAGFEKCMQLDHLVETTRTGAGAEHRVLGPDEIQPRCVAAEVALVEKTKDKALAATGVAITRRESSPELALDPVGALVKLSLPACNDSDIYSIVMRPMSEGYDTDYGKKHAIPIIKRCLKDKQFKQDFLEEKDSSDAVRAANVCQILLEAKLVKSCKGSK
ncbi:MAG: hypothetical protein HOV81_39960 [Kofleriaceae bacterium]|nr:hypothetical protein [Kofleriaceae bacterium]